MKSIPISDPNLPDESYTRISRQSRAILTAFKASTNGRLTNLELSAISQRFGARLHDLRQVGHVIELVSHDKKRGVTTYEIF